LIIGKINKRDQASKKFSASYDERLLRMLHSIMCIGIIWIPTYYVCDLNCEEKYNVVL